MKVELIGLEKELRNVTTSRLANGRILQGSLMGEPLAWIISGIGRDNAQQAVSEVAKHFQVDFLLSMGFAGGLSPLLGIGDLVICQKIWSENPGMQAYQTDAGLVETTMRIGKRLHCRTWSKDCLTVENMLHLPEQKAALYEKWNCDIVEMENFWIAEQASRLGLRCLAVRSISDSAQDSLPDFSAVIGSSGEISILGGMRHMANHPQDIKLLPGLYRNSKSARRNLQEFLDCFIQETAGEKTRQEYAH